MINQLKQTVLLLVCEWDIIIDPDVKSHILRLAGYDCYILSLCFNSTKDECRIKLQVNNGLLIDKT